MSLLISDATVLDGVADRPRHGQSIWIDGPKIKAIGMRDELHVSPGATVIDARDKYVIPGLMDSNVHLLLDLRFENLVRYLGRYEELIAEAAQIALRSGLTTVFDTWGPRRPLTTVRDRINSGTVVGSRIFCAGNIIGLDGPFSADFSAKTLEIASGAMAERINALYAENVGSNLGWMTPDCVADEVRAYIGKGIDFVKYASSEHRGDPSAFLAFSPRSQQAIVEQAHQSGITAQAHASSVEALWVAIEAGCDLIQHCNMTGPIPIPPATLELLARKRTGAVVFAFTKRRVEWIIEKTHPVIARMFSNQDTNVRNLIESGAMLLLGSDAGVVAPEWDTDPFQSQTRMWSDEAGENLGKLGEGHFHWLKAMEEKGLAPMEMLKATTSNIATAYGKDKDLGTLEAGKFADMIILDKDPLEAAENYRSIHMILKEGTVVDREALPTRPVLTKPPEPPSAEVLAYRAHRLAGESRFPCC